LARISRITPVCVRTHRQAEGTMCSGIRDSESPLQPPRQEARGIIATECCSYRGREVQGSKRPPEGGFNVPSSKFKGSRRGRHSRFKIQGSEFKVQREPPGAAFKVQSSRFKVPSSRFKVTACGRIQSSKFNIQGENMGIAHARTRRALELAEAQRLEAA